MSSSGLRHISLPLGRERNSSTSLRMEARGSTYGVRSGARLEATDEWSSKRSSGSSRLNDLNYLND